MPGHLQQRDRPQITLDLFVEDFDQKSLGNESPWLWFQHTFFYVILLVAVLIYRERTPAWPMLLITIMAGIVKLNYYCGSGSPQAFDAAHPVCAPTISRLAEHGHMLWSHFMLLQMALYAFSVPEADVLEALSYVSTTPQTKSLKSSDAANEGDNFSNEGSNSRGSARNVFLYGRFLPLVLYTGFQASHLSESPLDTLPALLLLDSLIFVVAMFCCWQVEGRASKEVLLYSRYWRRLSRYGWRLLAWLLWSVLIVASNRAESARLVIPLLFAPICIDLKRSLFNMDAMDIVGEDIVDANLTVAPALLGMVAFTLLPSLFLVLMFDTLGSGAWRWPTLYMISSRDALGSQLVAVLAVPVLVSITMVVWLLDMRCSRGAGPEDNSYNPVQATRSWCRKWARSQGYSGVAIGSLTAMSMGGPPWRRLLSLICGVISIGCFVAAIVLIVHSEEEGPRASPSLYLRRVVTLGLCVPLASTHIACQLLQGFLPHQTFIPFAIMAIVEYLSLISLSLWPLLWLNEMLHQQERQRVSNFAWPKTMHRFIRGTRVV